MNCGVGVASGVEVNAGVYFGGIGVAVITISTSCVTITVCGTTRVTSTPSGEGDAQPEKKVSNTMEMLTNI
jgi:hypothetical protein